MSFKKLLSEDVEKILTPESLHAIQEAFDQKVKLSVEAALIEQDELYAEKLSKLVNAIDKDHTKKMKRLVEAIDKNNSSKLVKIVKKFKRDSIVESTKFKDQLVESISSYMDTYLDEAFDRKDLEQAVKNKTAFNVLEKFRTALAVDSVMMQESVKDAVLDGKSQIDNLQRENSELKKKLSLISEQADKFKVKSILEEKTAKLPETKKNFIRKALQDKSLKFIQENFDYTVRLFDKQEKEKLTTLKEEALNNRYNKPDVVPVKKIIEEKVNTNISHGDEYLDVMSKIWSPKK
jgi:3-methyladenine DNA glycosylase AlkC